MINNLFSIVRVIGNDLPPRHSVNQSIDNLRRILSYEPNIPGVVKIWILNRIVCQEKLSILFELINSAGYTCVTLPYSHQTYLDLPRNSFVSDLVSPFARRKKLRRDIYSRRFRLLYITNVNAARNLAISLGHLYSTWALPLDGNCMFTNDGLSQLVNTVARACSHFHYLVIPLVRDPSRASLALSDLILAEEPQIGFHQESCCRFNENFFYGRRDKAELLKRLGITGDWVTWNSDPWEDPPPELEVNCDQILFGGNVVRLSSGSLKLDTSCNSRSSARDLSILSFLNTMDSLRPSSDCLY